MLNKKDFSKRIVMAAVILGRLDERLDNLIGKLEVLNFTLKWFIMLILGGIVGFFFYALKLGVL